VEEDSEDDLSPFRRSDTDDSSKSVHEEEEDEGEERASDSPPSNTTKRGGEKEDKALKLYGVRPSHLGKDRMMRSRIAKDKSAEDREEESHEVPFKSARGRGRPRKQPKGHSQTPELRPGAKPTRAVQPEPQEKAPKEK